MDKVSKKQLKQSKRKEKDVSKKIKNLTKQGKLEEELGVFQSDEKIICTSPVKETKLKKEKKVKYEENNDSVTVNDIEIDSTEDGKKTDKVSKKSLKKSKRDEKEMSKKVKKLLKQDELEEELDIDNVDVNNTLNADKNDEIKDEKTISKDIKFDEEGNLMEVDNSCIDESGNKPTTCSESNCAIILNLPHDASREELSNFLSKRDIPVDALTIDNSKYVVIETEDPEALNKIKNLANKPNSIYDDSKVLSLTGNSQRLAAFCQRNTIYNKSIIVVKNINVNTKIEDVLALVPAENEVKKHSVFKVHYKKTKTQMVSIELETDFQSEKVIAKLNGSVLDDNKLIAEFKHKLVEDSKLESQSLTLLVRGLPETTSYQTIKDLELPCNKIELIKKFAKRMCFLTFANVKDVTEAYEKLSTKEINGSKVSVKFVNTNTTTGEKPAEDVDLLKLHITNLPYSCTKEDIEKEFDMAESLKFPTNSAGKSKGCCYLSFSSVELAALAMEAFTDKLINGRKIRCKYAKKSDYVPETKTETKSKSKPKVQDNVVTLFNLPISVTADELKQKFKNVKLVHIVKRDGVFKGIAEVHFANQKQAKDVVDGPEMTIGGRKIRAELKGGKWREGTARTRKPRQKKPKVEKSENE